MSFAGRAQRVAVRTAAALGCIFAVAYSNGNAATTTNAGAFATGVYRNLFVESGRAPAQVTARMDIAFRQLFHGNPNTEAVYFPSGTNANGPLGYISDVANNDVRSEGMSYGMMIAVQLNRKAEFDSLWNWSRTFMYHASRDHPSCGYFSWSMKTNGVPNDEMPAPDGESYFITALYFAAARWGNGSGIFDYQHEADQLLEQLRHRTLITGKIISGTNTIVVTAGALFHPDRKMVRFTPDVKNWEHTDPSYQLPAFYELWGRWGPKRDRSFWIEAAAASREFFERAAHPTTGLTSDYANFDGTPWTAPWNPDSGNFYSDSWRSAMNWSVDWAWWAKDPRAIERSDRLQSFFESKGLSKYGFKFTIDGRQIGDAHAGGLVAMNAVASLAAANPRARRFVDELWKTPVPTGKYRYYDGMLYLFALLHCSGEFRIWSPN
jgi:oligosaccharide reducing-end xylanase